MKPAARISAALALALVGFSGAAAQASQVATFGGSVLERAYGSYSGSGGSSSDDFGYGSSTTLELDLDAKGPRARASASLEAAVLDGASAQSTWLLIEEGRVPSDELFVPAARPDGGSDLLMAARVRTLYVKLDADWASLTAGRQVVNYERGALWSPTDIFTNLDLTGLSPVRLGGDALRLAFPFGATEGLDLVAAPGAKPARGLYSARFSGFILGVDGALSAARDGASRIGYLGADFKADLEVGLYGDLSCALPDSGAAGRTRAAGGADWSTGDFIFAAEYYYNGVGSAADPLFPGAHNVYGDLTWRASQLFSLSASVIEGCSDRTGTGLLQASISAAQNASLSLYCKATWAEGDASPAGQAGATIAVSF
jgi:hypothetical protein